MVGVGIIGCGSIATFRHAPEYATNPDSKIIGFFDIDVERAKAMVDKYGGKVFESYEAMLSDSEITAVSVCSSNAFHAPITIASLKAGKHVLCEKPMATTIEDSILMIDAARKAKKFLMIGHNQRLAPAHLKAKEIIESGKLGKILSFKTTFGHKGPEYWSIDKTANTWFFDKNVASMGVIGDLGMHKIELMRWLIGEKIGEVSAFLSTLDKKDSMGNPISVDDNAVCLLKSVNGILGTLTVSWTCYGDEENYTKIYCKEGTLKIYDDPSHDIVIVKKDGERYYCNVGKIQTNEVQVKSGIIDMFIDSIEKNLPPSISGEVGLETMKIAFACIESSKTGKAIKLI
ncbi:MAG TPA: Gfo/Idh/MocA family oxidoreductase [Clostridiaceae bacterium]